MNNSPRIRSPLNDTALDDDQSALVDNATHLEQQMAALGLSSETRRFLRDVHRAEKVLNQAYDKTHQDGVLDKRISQIYRDLYGSDETSPTES